MCPALLLVSADYVVAQTPEFFLSLVQLDSSLLIKCCGLMSDTAASAVDHQILCPVLGLIDLNEMISAAQCSQALLQTVYLTGAAEAAHLRQVEVLYALIPDTHA